MRFSVFRLVLSCRLFLIFRKSPVHSKSSPLRLRRAEPHLRFNPVGAESFNFFVDLFSVVCYNKLVKFYPERLNHG